MSRSIAAICDVTCRRTSASLATKPLITGCPAASFSARWISVSLFARSKDQAERLQDAADLSVEFTAHRHELMPGAEYCPALVRGDALGVHLAIPAHPQHVGQASSIAAVRFSRPDRQRGVGMSCI